jgi:hypothetical protein
LDKDLHLPEDGQVVFSQCQDRGADCILFLLRM